MAAPARSNRARVAELIARRAAALERFARWEAEHPPAMSGAAAVEGIGALYELLPSESRHRPPAADGVARLQDLLNALAPSSE